MNATLKPLTECTVEDVMTEDLVCLPATMPLRQAARLLIKNQIGGAPVVDSDGHCIGVLSSFDFLRLAERRADATKPAAPPLPITCSFQTTRRMTDGRELIQCTLAAGACPIQSRQRGRMGEEFLVCSQPHSVLVDWQAVEVENLSTDEVRHFMTADPVTVAPATSLRTLARMMIDAHIHRVIVVDEQHRPIGVVSSTNLLAVLARDDQL